MHNIINIAESPLEVSSAPQACSGPPTRTRGDSYLPGVYGIWCSANEKWYVGSSVSVTRRWHAHHSKLIAGQHENALLQRAWIKYGASSFLWVHITNVTKDELETRELQVTEELQALYPTGFVLRAGGGGGRTADDVKTRVAETKRRCGISEHTREKLRAARRGKLASAATRRRMSIAKLGHMVSTETRAKLSAAHMGHTVSVETRAKIAAARKYYVVSDATRLKISKGHKSHPCTAETRMKISQARMGFRPSAASREKMSQSQRRRGPISEETRLKLKQAQRNRGPITEETRRRMSEAAKLRCARQAQIKEFSNDDTD